MSNSTKNTNIDAVDEKGWTALHHAAKNGELKEVKRLLAAGANVDVTTKQDINDVFSRSTPLHLASHYAHVEIAKMLLDQGADIEVRDALVVSVGCVCKRWLNFVSHTTQIYTS